MTKSAKDAVVALKLQVLMADGGMEGLVGDLEFDDADTQKLLSMSTFLNMQYDSETSDESEDKPGPIVIKLLHNPKVFRFEPRHTFQGISFLVAMGLEFPMEFYQLKVQTSDITKLMLDYYRIYRYPALKDTPKYQRYNGTDKQYHREVDKEYSLLVTDRNGYEIYEFCQSLLDIDNISLVLDFARYYGMQPIEKCVNLAVGCLVYVTSPKELEEKKKKLNITSDYSEADPEFMKAYKAACQIKP